MADPRLRRAEGVFAAGKRAIMIIGGQISIGDKGKSAGQSSPGRRDGVLVVLTCGIVVVHYRGYRAELRRAAFRYVV